VFISAALTMRDDTRQFLHALRSAGDPAVTAAAADYTRRVIEARPYEDAGTVEELLALATK
jgi:hypothetical protein